MRFALRSLGYRRDPDVKKPNLVVPSRGSDDVVRPKRATRSASTDEKLSMKGSKPAVGIGIDELDVDSEVLGSKEGDGEVMEAANSLDRDGYDVMTGADAERQEITQNNVNDILNPSKESVNVGSNVSNVGQRKESNENVSWLSLNENGSNVWNKKAVSNEVGSSNDTIMEDGNKRRPISFVNVFQGISGNGSNKLVRVPVQVNDQGREVVVMDPVVEERSMCMEKPKPDKVPLWVKIMNVPLEAWNA
ncbi:hypothetical protein Tco_1431902 [Tanacetum coccineum]